MTARDKKYASYKAMVKSNKGQQAQKDASFLHVLHLKIFSYFKIKDKDHVELAPDSPFRQNSNSLRKQAKSIFMQITRFYQKAILIARLINHLQIELQLLMTEHQFNLQDSQEDLLVPTDWLPRQKSNDSIFNELIRAPIYGERPLLFTIPPTIDHEQSLPKVFKSKEKKRKVKKPCDYRKNICGYITKKIIREYISTTYKPKVQLLCDKHGCDYSTSKSFFLSKIERVTGPSHVPSLFVATEPWERPIKAAFREFFIWFTKERYLRYLILEGKMEQKEAYIEYKNTVLMSLVNKSEELDKQHDPSPLINQCHSQ